jgi:hypothetical protein
MVRAGDSSARSALRRATGLALRPTSLPRAIAVWLVLGLASAALLALQTVALVTIDPLPVWPGLLVAQLLALVGAWLKVARLAVALALDQALI